MKKIGRNALCPCGSGKKYKKCHGAVAAASQNAPGGRSDRRMFQLPHTGMPGQTHHITLVAQFGEADDARNRTNSAGQPGRYKVIFVFNRPGYPLRPEGSIDFSDALKGDSHLAILPPALRFRGDERPAKIRIDATTSTETLVFEAYANERGFLGKIVLESIHAQGFADAELRAYRALAPTLSNWSVQRDIPLHVWQTDSVEIATGNMRTTLLNPYLEAAFGAPGEFAMSDEFKRYASLYREALSSNSSAYQFLCFFKIIEGIQARRRRIGGEARNRREEPRRYNERVPADDKDRDGWLNAIFYGRPQWDALSLDEIFPPGVLGKKLSRIIDSELRPLRVAIAHAILDSGEPTLMADEQLDVQKITRWLPLNKCIARRLLKNEFPVQFLPDIDDGKFSTELAATDS